MSLKVSSDPYGYKKLLVYRKAEELQGACAAFTSHFPRLKTLYALQDQMDRSARSVKQNIVEGWKRNSTQEYHQFLGFSMGANAELEEDCDDIIKGRYEMGGRGIRGLEGEKWEGKGEMGGRGNPSPLTLDEVERLPFYPFNPHLPPLVQLKLRCKELNFLLTKLQTSLHQKMQSGTEGIIGSAWGTGERGKGAQDFLVKMIDDAGLEKLPDGHLVPKKKV